MPRFIIGRLPKFERNGQISFSPQNGPEWVSKPADAKQYEDLALVLREVDRLDALGGYYTYSWERLL